MNRREFLKLTGLVAGAVAFGAPGVNQADTYMEPVEAGCGARASACAAGGAPGWVMSGYCRVCWGSHACDLPRGHPGPHRCDCADEPTMHGATNVGGYPYYGPLTTFYGQDVGELERSGRWLEAWKS